MCADCGQLNIHSTTSADCGAKAPLCIEQPVCESWSLAQPELRLSELLRGVVDGGKAQADNTHLEVQGPP